MAYKRSPKEAISKGLLRLGGAQQALFAFGAGRFGMAISCQDFDPPRSRPMNAGQARKLFRLSQGWFQKGEHMHAFHKMIPGGMVSRLSDAYGSGQFGMPRSGHRHGNTHEGLDVVSKPGQAILSPIGGDIVRESLPYGRLSPYSGVVIKGAEEWAGYEVKVFYVVATRSGKIRPGELLGTAQDLRMKYPKITNHIHIEIRFLGRLLSPMEQFWMCF